jgi:hypothetical protein
VAVSAKARRVPHRLLEARAGQGREAGRNERRFFDRRLRVLLEVAQKPPRGREGMPARILARDQERQLEGVGKG